MWVLEQEFSHQHEPYINVPLPSPLTPTLRPTPPSAHVTSKRWLVSLPLELRPTELRSCVKVEVAVLGSRP